MSILTARGLVRNFEGLHVLDGVNLNVREGEFLAIVGRSGVGKSTLLGVLGTHDPGYTGSLSIGGRDVSGLNQVEKVNSVRLNAALLAVRK